MKAHFGRLQTASTSIIGSLLLAGLFSCSQPGEIQLSSAKVATSSVASTSNGAINDLNTGTAINSCQDELLSSNVPVKVYFLVDTSGSNKNSTGGAGTDPDKSWRLTALNNFVSTYQAKSNFFYGMATFQGTTSKSLISSAAGQATFSNDLNIVQSGITAFQNTADSDKTPYQAALDKAYEAISLDLLTATLDTVYSIVMISDGAPTDFKIADLDKLASNVKTLINLAPSRIKFNAAFYSRGQAPTDDDTVYLKTMATAGGGVVVGADSTVNLSISDFIQVPGFTCD